MKSEHPSRAQTRNLPETPCRHFSWREFPNTGLYRCIWHFQRCRSGFHCTGQTNKQTNKHGGSYFLYTSWRWSSVDLRIEENPPLLLLLPSVWGSGLRAKPPLLEPRLHLPSSLPEARLVRTTAERDLTGEDSSSALRLRTAAAIKVSHLAVSK